ncbi:PQQ-binding-like beta-propeller repeat protein [Actinoplanes sp. RD1]|uniref:hypothetical protein n=1 Tax=Actinoplanes sp. RD1 TaxID=3064538 RepID=UPI0027408FB3|nr:hypothetical protein [Actinoplanes sp. RD1]
MPLARRLLLTAVAATLTVAAGAAPARAITTGPARAPQFNGPVYAIAYRGDTVYVGGAFTSAESGGRSYSRSRLAAFDASSGALLDWAPAADSTVRALAVSGSSVYAGGSFRRVSGWIRDNLVRLDASSGAVGSFSHQVTGAPYSMVVGNGRLYVGGSFEEIDGSARGNLAAFSLSSGALDSRWRPAADDSVHALALAGARVYAGGGFHKVGGVPGTLRLAAISASSGAVDRGFTPKPDSQVNSIAVDGGTVYAATGGQGGRALAYTTAGRLKWQRVFDGDAVAIATLGGSVYVGGHFDKICRSARNGSQGACLDGSYSRVKLASLTGAGALTSWAPQANGVIGVRTLVAHGGAMSAGGDFTAIGGQIRKRFATFR